MKLHSWSQKLTENNQDNEKFCKEKDNTIEALNEDVNDLMESLEEQRSTINLCRDSTKDLFAQRKELILEVVKLKAENIDLIEENVQLIEKLMI